MQEENSEKYLGIKNIVIRNGFECNHFKKYLLTILVSADLIGIIIKQTGVKHGKTNSKWSTPF